ncbi:hypothetical protein RRG08_026308 [Elysia crispata]|uniref:Uncharacterized protein n=1 Tax=Elysia crispata TaxID=231223 RepID=A0AAE1DCV2_9GAST|nr:hypothetical protein RRG08_026308 [Elysia crispata]
MVLSLSTSGGHGLTRAFTFDLCQSPASGPCLGSSSSEQSRELLSFYWTCTDCSTSVNLCRCLFDVLLFLRVPNLRESVLYFVRLSRTGHSVIAGLCLVRLSRTGHSVIAGLCLVRSSRTGHSVIAGLYVGSRRS